MMIIKSRREGMVWVEWPPVEDGEVWCRGPDSADGQPATVHRLVDGRWVPGEWAGLDGERGGRDACGPDGLLH